MNKHANDITVQATVVDADTIRYGGSTFKREHACIDPTNGIDEDHSTCSFTPTEITHRHPDSLEKLRDDMMAANECWDGDPNKLVDYADRLTALIERGA